MDPRQIEEFHVHPAQLAALKASGLVFDAQTHCLMREGETAPEPLWHTRRGQQVFVSKHLPEEGLFLPGSKAVRVAAKTEAGDERRRQALKRYREHFRTSL